MEPIVSMLVIKLVAHAKVDSVEEYVTTQKQQFVHVVIEHKVMIVFQTKKVLSDHPRSDQY